MVRSEFLRDRLRFVKSPMRGRYTLSASPQADAKVFRLDDTPLFSPRYNIAPTQQVLAIRLQDGRRQANFLHWGLIPSWPPIQQSGTG